MGVLYVLSIALAKLTTRKRRAAAAAEAAAAEAQG
jgi:Sec-independent protein secretion pathway component TatC